MDFRTAIHDKWAINVDRIYQEVKLLASTQPDMKMRSDCIVTFMTIIWPGEANLVAHFDFLKQI